MNCLAHALDLWHEDGGYIVLRKSAARTTPHVLHIGDEGRQRYSPGAPLGHPAVPIRGIVVGAWLLALGATGWGLKRMIWRK